MYICILYVYGLYIKLDRSHWICILYIYMYTWHCDIAIFSWSISKHISMSTCFSQMFSNTAMVSVACSDASWPDLRTRSANTGNVLWNPQCTNLLMDQLGQNWDGLAELEWPCYSFCPTSNLERVWKPVRFRREIWNPHCEIMFKSDSSVPAPSFLWVCGRGRPTCLASGTMESLGLSNLQWWFR